MKIIQKQWKPIYLQIIEIPQLFTFQYVSLLFNITIFLKLWLQLGVTNECLGEDYDENGYIVCGGIFLSFHSTGRK